MSTDQHEEIAALLREIPVPPSQITTDRVLSLGRKATRRRRHGIAAAAAIAVVAATAGGLTLAQPSPRPAPLTLPSPSPSASPAHIDYSSWKATTLPLPAGMRKAKVVAMDSSGRYVLGMTEDYKAILWEDLTPRVLPAPAGANDQVIPVDVNASGVVIGSTLSGFIAWVYRDGVSTKLAGPGATYSAGDINDRGDILGWSQHAGSLVWPGDSPGTPRAVPEVDAFGINEDGVVGGFIGDREHPVVVGLDGQVRRLAEAPGKPGGEVYHVSGDWACGWVAAGNKFNWMAARWRLSTGELTSFPDAQSNCTGLSDSGALLSARESAGAGVLVTPAGTLVEMPTDGKAGHPNLRAISADASVIAGNISVVHDSAPPDHTPTIWRRSPAK